MRRHGGWRRFVVREPRVVPHHLAVSDNLDAWVGSGQVGVYRASRHLSLKSSTAFRKTVTEKRPYSLSSDTKLDDRGATNSENVSYVAIQALNDCLQRSPKQNSNRYSISCYDTLRDQHGRGRTVRPPNKVRRVSIPIGTVNTLGVAYLGTATKMVTRNSEPLVSRCSGLTKLTKSRVKRFPLQCNQLDLGPLVHESSTFKQHGWVQRDSSQGGRGAQESARTLIRVVSSVSDGRVLTVTH